MEALRVEECRRFLAAARETDWLGLYVLALTAGLRPSEYLALKRSDIDGERPGISSAANGAAYIAGGLVPGSWAECRGEIWLACIWSDGRLGSVVGPLHGTRSGAPRKQAKIRAAA